MAGKGLSRFTSSASKGTAWKRSVLGRPSRWPTEKAAQVRGHREPGGPACPFWPLWPWRPWAPGRPSFPLLPEGPVTPGSPFSPAGEGTRGQGMGSGVTGGQEKPRPQSASLLGSQPPAAWEQEGQQGWRGQQELPEDGLPWSVQDVRLGAWQVQLKAAAAQCPRTRACVAGVLPEGTWGLHPASPGGWA